MQRPILFLLCSVLLFVSGILAQSQKGKLSGKVIDEKSGDPIPGVNVSIEGTALGAVTDIEGNYFILNIFPGRYSVAATMLGYAKLTKTDAEIYIDRTTTVDFILKEASVEIGEVIVVAERPRIVKDQTSTTQTIDASQIRTAAVEGTKGILDLNSSFQRTSTGQFTVRGSGAYEVGLQINGVDQISASTTSPGAFGNDKANTSWKFDVNPLAVQQIQIITGGFSAEYGNAQAGIAKIVTKEGSPKFSGEVRFEYRPQGQYHFGTYAYDPSNLEWKTWGNFDHWKKNRVSLEKDLRLDVRYASIYGVAYSTAANKTVKQKEDSAFYRQIADRELDWAYNVWVKNHTPSDDNPLGVYDYRNRSYNRMLIGFGGPLGRDPDLLKFYFSGEYRKNPTRLPTPEKDQIFQNYILSVTYLPEASHKFKILGMYQRYRGGIWSGSDDIRYSGLAFSPPGTSTKYYVNVDPVRTEQTFTQSLNYVNTISTRSFFEVTLTHSRETYELPYEFLYGTVQSADRLDSLNDKDGGVVLLPGQWYDSYFRSPFNFSTNYYQDNRTEHVNLTADYSHQLNTENYFKTGIRFGYWDMINNGVNSNFLANAYVSGTGFAEYYHAYPYLISLYAQDKIEYSGMVANIGVRMEGYNFQAPVPVDMFNPFYTGTNGTSVGNPNTTPSDFQYIVLPRFGISFPIGEQTAFRMQYGHFASMPIFAHAFQQRTESGVIGKGNPNLLSKKTINYEMGVQQMLDEDHRLDAAIFYNDRVRQIGLLRIAAFSGSNNRPNGYSSDNTRLYNYTTYSNNAFGATNGLELTIERVGVARWGYRISYTLSQTTSGNYGPQTLFPENASIQRQDYTSEEIDGSDRTHSLRGLLSYHLRENEGIEIIGITPFSNTTFGLTYTMQTGTPFTYSTSTSVANIVLNQRYPIESNFDLNIQKSLVIDDYRFTLGIRMMNVFNNKWLTPIDNATDIESWIKTGITLDNPGFDPARLGYVASSFKAYRNIPRQVFVTLGFGL